jgi:hypothetical protein
MAVMAGVFRKKEKAWSKNSLVGYGIHGTFAVLSLWMFVQAVN